jgi:ABC-type iron transport system FetAB ATPase subunit
MALLGELHYIPNTNNSWMNLPRAGGIAYAAQESWVLNDTIRNNIIFTSDFDQTRYEKGETFQSSPFARNQLTRDIVLHQCALDQDLSLFKAGDATEVGEKGLTLRYEPAFMVLRDLF